MASNILPSRDPLIPTVPESEQVNITHTPAAGAGTAAATATDPEDNSASRLAHASSSRAHTESKLRFFKLWEALRLGEPATLIPLLAAYPSPPTVSASPALTPTPRLSGGLSRTSSALEGGAAGAGDTLRQKGIQTPLHLAVKCAKYPTVDLVLRHRKNDLNVQDPANGQTALHLAAANGRNDVVALLLAQPEIDDSIIDRNGQSCLDVARGADVHNAISTSRQQFNETYVDALRQYVSLPSTTPVAALEDTKVYKLLDRPRARIIDFSQRDHATGTTLLHEAVRRQDAATLRLAISKGADVLVRDRKGKKAVDLVGKESTGRASTVRNLLRRSANILPGSSSPASADSMEVKRAVKDGQSANAATVASSSASMYSIDARISDRGSNAPPPTIICKGYLKKWTNVGRGYQTRYFVLQDGFLAYYRAKEDEGKATKGAINMSAAKLVIPQDDKTGLRFEIIATVTGRFPKLYMKADHQIEAMRWKTSLNQAIQVAQPGTDPIASASATKSPTAEGSRSYAPSLAPSLVDSKKDVPLGDSENDQGVDGASVIADDDTFNGDSVDGTNAPHEGHMDLMANSLRTHIELTEQLLDALVLNGSPASRSAVDVNAGNDSAVGMGISGTPSGSASAAPSRPPSVRSLQAGGISGSTYSLAGAGASSNNVTTRQSDVKEALRHSLRELLNMTNSYFGAVSDREKFFVRRYEKEIEAKNLWEENMKEAAAAQAELEMELKKVTRDNSRRKKALKTVRQSVLDGLLDPEGMGAGGTLSAGGRSASRPASVVSNDLAAHVAALGVGTSPPPVGGHTTASGHRLSVDGGRPSSFVSAVAGSPTVEQELSIPSTVTPTHSRLRSASVASPRAPMIVEALEEAGSSEDEGDSDHDEFFEAIDEGTLPLQVDNALTAVEAHRENVPEGIAHKVDDQMDTLESYKEFRTKLPITSDDRPTVSLWGFLKSSIGKDLTKISLPVSFNECTSMLQRMAEDMEFSECLDAAANDPDPAKRVAYVAAFAMSNYSSTLGRVAKPFNPMLGETFEYVRLDKMYRYMSEQVSHHPPMSACICESLKWKYYGEVDAKSKFTGKTFEIRPTGIAHAALWVPPDFVSDPSSYPRHPHRLELVEEHYSWKKVTSSVSNLILGTPQIDHYGDMEITNHRTGHKCVLTFKPRGWRAKDAFEIAGYVENPNGERAWDIAGRWTSQLVAKRAGTGNVGPDDLPSTSRGDYFLLWQNSKKPDKTAFNLTPFAITLNDTPEELRTWLPPTDCRLRPDQHAFEHGAFERANSLKSDLEEFQRATRRAREKGDRAAHKPRWFTKAVDADTGERVWEPAKLSDGSLEYWEERAKVGRARKGIPAAEWDSKPEWQWKDVEEIYPRIQEL